MGIADRLGFGKLRESLGKTRENLFGRVSRVFTAKAVIDDEVLEELEEILISADIGVDVAAGIISGIQERARKNRYANTDELNQLFKEELRTSLTKNSSPDPAPESSPHPRQPHVVLVVGVNGVGKTTTIGKLAYRYRNEGKRVMIAASDTFRAAAIEQLEVWAGRSGAEMVRQKHGADPAAVAFDAYNSAVAGKYDVLLVDTAGRLHTRLNLMQELQKIRRVLQKGDSSAPQETLLILDATTGQNGLRQAKEFREAVEVTGLVLSKLDGTAKGGIVFAIASELNIPVSYVGVGEGLEDLRIFRSEEFVEALLS